MLRKLAKDVIAYGGTDFLFRGAQFAALPIYAHLLTLEQFAVLALLQVTSALFGLLLNLGVNNAVQRFYYDEGTPAERRPTLVSTGLAQLTMSLFAGLPAFAMLAWVLLQQGVFSPEIGAWLIAITVLTVFPEQIAQYTLDVVRLQFAPKRFLAISLVKNFLGLVLGLWLAARWDMGVGGILLGTLIAATLSVPIGLFCIRRDLVAQFDRTLVRRGLRFGIPYVLASAAYWVFGSMDRWLIAALSDVGQVGLFSVAIKFAGVIAFMMSAFGAAWSPFAFRLRSQDVHYPAFYARMLVIWFAFLAIAGLATSLFASEALILLTPRDYWPAAPLISVCAAGLTLYGTTLITTMGIQIEKRTLLLTWGAWLAGAVNVLANMILIPRYGALGAAIATLMTYATLTSLYLRWSQRLHPIPIEWPKLAYCFVLVALTAIVALLPTGIDPLIVLFKSLLLAAAVIGVLASRILDFRTLRSAWSSRTAAGEGHS